VLVVAALGPFLGAPAAASEFPAFELLDVRSGIAPECDTVAPLHLPPTWKTGDGAIVLLTVTSRHDAMRDALIEALLSEEAAVLELGPARCEGSRDGNDSVITGALGALEAVTRTAGAGLVVAIGYGRGGTAVLDLVREPAANLLGANGPRYAAAVAIDRGRLAFALAPRLPAREQAAFRLTALCQALAAALAGMGASTCRDMAGESSHARVSSR
jgi:hypothetical protein